MIHNFALWAALLVEDRSDLGTQHISGCSPKHDNQAYQIYFPYIRRFKHMILADADLVSELSKVCSLRHQVFSWLTLQSHIATIRLRTISVTIPNSQSYTLWLWCMQLHGSVLSQDDRLQGDSPQVLLCSWKRISAQLHFRNGRNKLYLSIASMKFSFRNVSFP